MNKKEFIEKVLTMEHPVMSSHMGDRNLLSKYFVIKDKNNCGNKFCTQSVKLSHLEYLNGNTVAYYKREIALQRKIEAWLYDICGNYCTIES